MAAGFTTNSLMGSTMLYVNTIVVLSRSLQSPKIRSHISILLQLFLQHDEEQERKKNPTLLNLLWKEEKQRANLEPSWSQLWNSTCSGFQAHAPGSGFKFDTKYVA